MRIPRGGRVFISGFGMSWFRVMRAKKLDHQESSPAVYMKPRRGWKVEPNRAVEYGFVASLIIMLAVQIARVQYLVTTSTIIRVGTYAPILLMLFLVSALLVVFLKRCCVESNRPDLDSESQMKRIVLMLVGSVPLVSAALLIGLTSIPSLAFMVWVWLEIAYALSKEDSSQPADISQQERV